MFHARNADNGASLMAGQTTLRQPVDRRGEISATETHESVPKIIINGAIIFFLNCAISILVISNHNSSRVPFDKIASVSLYFIREIY